MARIRFMNTEIDNLTMDEALDRIDELIQENRNAFVVTPNVDHIVRIEHDDSLSEAYRNADLILTDGKPLIWISKWYRNPIKEKISGSDLFPKLCEMASIKGYRMYFLGAAEGVAKKAADKLKERFSGLEVVGTYSPCIGFENNKEELKRIKSQIKKAKPEILVVGLGCPKQRLF